MTAFPLKSVSSKTILTLKNGLSFKNFYSVVSHGFPSCFSPWSELVGSPRFRVVAVCIRSAISFLESCVFVKTRRHSWTCIPAFEPHRTGESASQPFNIPSHLFLPQRILHSSVSGYLCAYLKYFQVPLLLNLGS